MNAHLRLLALTVACVAAVTAGCSFLPGSGTRNTTSATATDTISVSKSLVPTVKRLQNPQIGLNFIRFYWSARPTGVDTENPRLQPDSIFADFKALGAQSYRQFVKADLFWDVVEPAPGQWHFTEADAVILNSEAEPVVTLFRMQYASPTPPWISDPAKFQKTLGPEATAYLETVVKRYGPYVRYWEIGNEMSLWRAGDPGDPGPRAKGARPPISESKSAEERLPASRPAEGYSPSEQGAFLAQAAAVIRKHDSDAIILMPGMPSLSEYDLGTWLPGVVEGGGTEWFDIVNYHYYGGWESHAINRPKLTTALSALRIRGKRVWETETGSTSDPELTARTNYPNSTRSQAADVFRRIVQSWGHGDSLVMWHTYLPSADSGTNWSAYGLLTVDGARKPAYYAYKLLTSELIPFASVEKLSSDPRGACAYRIRTETGETRYVAWGTGTFVIPGGVREMTSVIPSEDGTFSWGPVKVGARIQLTADPVLIR